MTVRWSKVEFYMAGAYRLDIIAFLKDRIDAYTLERVTGIWKGAVEIAWRLTVFKETDTPAHNWHAPNGDIFMPAIADSVEPWARNLAEELARVFGQDAVGYSIQPTQWELTTAQAKYTRTG